MERKIKRLTKEQIRRIIQLGKTGTKYKDIAREIKCSISTVEYHLKEKSKERSIERAKKSKKKWEGRKDYIKNYMKTRYNEDEEFRERVKKHSRESMRRRYKSGK